MVLAAYTLVCHSLANMVTPNFFTFFPTRSLVAVEPPRPPMTDVGTETAFRLDQREHFRKSKHLLRSESVDVIFTCVELHDIVPVSRSINMLSITDFVPKGIISGVSVQAGLHLDMLDADRSPNMQSAFLPELHRWISKLTDRHLRCMLVHQEIF